MAFLRSIFGRDKDQTTANSSPSQQQIARPDTRAMVFVGGQDHKLRALDAHTGKQKWEFDAGGWGETIPATWQGVLIGTSWNLQTDEARVLALDILTASTVCALRPGWGATCSPAAAPRMAACLSPSASGIAASRVPSASRTTARRVRSAFICSCMAFITSIGGSIRWISTRTTRTPHLSVASSMIAISPPLIFSREVRHSSRVNFPAERQSAA